MQLLKDRIRKDGKIKSGECAESRQFFKSPDGY